MYKQYFQNEIIIFEKKQKISCEKGVLASGEYSFLSIYAISKVLKIFDVKNMMQNTVDNIIIKSGRC